MARQTEDRVREVIEELGYRPNVSARGLRSRSTRMLGFIVGDAAEDYLGDPLTDLFLAGLGAALRQNDYALLVDSYRPGGSMEAALRHVDEGRVDGAVVMLSGSPDERRRALEQLLSRGRPLVLLQEHTQLLDGFTSVSAKDYEGSYRLCRHLVEQGHTRISYLTTVEQWSALEQRIQGYSDAMEEAGLEAHVSIRYAPRFSTLAGLESGLEMLGQPERPTAIMCGNDQLAIGVLRAAAQLGIHVPEQLAVTGFNDFPFAAVTVPSITTVRLPGREMGEAAAEALLTASATGSAVDLPPHDVEVMLRESTGG